MSDLERRLQSLGVSGPAIDFADVGLRARRIRRRRAASTSVAGVVLLGGLTFGLNQARDRADVTAIGGDAPMATADADARDGWSYSVDPTANRASATAAPAPVAAPAPAASDAPAATDAPAPTPAPTDAPSAAGEPVAGDGGSPSTFPVTTAMDSGLSSLPPGAPPPRCQDSDTLGWSQAAADSLVKSLADAVNNGQIATLESCMLDPSLLTRRLSVGEPLVVLRSSSNPLGEPALPSYASLIVQAPDDLLNLQLQVDSVGGVAKVVSITDEPPLMSEEQARQTVIGWFQALAAQRFEDAARTLGQGGLSERERQDLAVLFLADEGLPDSAPLSERLERWCEVAPTACDTVAAPEVVAVHEVPFSYRVRVRLRSANGSLPEFDVMVTWFEGSVGIELPTAVRG